MKVFPSGTFSGSSTAKRRSYSRTSASIAWGAVRAAGGSLPTAAGALGISTLQLIEILRTDRVIRLQGASGTRRRVNDDGTGQES